MEHTLGVVHLCHGFGKRCGLNSDELRLLRLAALFHDIGHGPYSHLTEKILWRNGWQLSHETISALLVKESFFEVIGNNEALEISNVIAKKHTDKRLTTILSGTIDADRIDYVFRDIYNAGLPYKIVHLDPLLNTIKIDKDGAHIDLATGLDFIEIEPIFLLRDYMKWYIDKDPRCRAINALVIKAIESMVESEKSNFFSDVSPAKELKSTEDLPRFSRLTDYELFCEIQKGNKFCKMTADMISRATCYEFSGHLFEKDVDQTFYAPTITRLKTAQMRVLEKRIEEELEREMGILSSPLRKILLDFPKFEQHETRPADLIVSYPEHEILSVPLSYNLAMAKRKKVPFKSLPIIGEVLERTGRAPICIFCNSNLGSPTKSAIVASFIGFLKTRNRKMDQILEEIKNE